MCLRVPQVSAKENKYTHAVSDKIHFAPADYLKEQPPMLERFKVPHNEATEWFSDICAELQISALRTL